MKRFGIALAAMAMAALPGSAQAANFLLHYDSTGAAPLVADLTVTTSDVLNAVGGYDVIGISGDVSGDEITGLTVNTDQPNARYSADCWFIFDNVYYPGAPELSSWGLLFTSATHEYNLFSDNATQYELYQATPGVGYTANSVGSLFSSQVHLGHPQNSEAAAAVPEPTSWLTMAVGFGLLGGLMRNNRKARTEALA